MGFRCMEKKAGEKGEGLREGSGFEDVLREMKKKQGMMRVWKGPGRRESAL